MALDMTIREPGTLVDDKYKLDRVLGRGGMGAVYEATQKPLGRRVALKILLSKLASDNPDVIRRFHQEAKLAASIGHDNICEVTDMGTDADGSPYLVMPLLRGCPMNILMREQKLPLERVIPMFSQILSGLQAAHSAKIVHRDLKPANIYVCKIGPHNDFIKLLDFGISKVLSQETVMTLTRTGEILGTPHYMSPEQAMDPKDVDHRSDIYAVGVMLYEAVLQRLPFEGKSYAEVLYKIISEPLLPPRQVMPSVPESLEAVIIKAMARDREDRFEHAVQFQTALEQCLKEMRRGSYDPGPLTDLADSRAEVNTGVDLHQATTRHPIASAAPAPSAASDPDPRPPQDKKSGAGKVVALLFVLLALGAIATAAFVVLRGTTQRPATPVIPAVQQPLSSGSTSSAPTSAAKTQADDVESAPRLQLVDPIDPPILEPTAKAESDRHPKPRAQSEGPEPQREQAPARASRKEKGSASAQPKKTKDEDIYQNPVDVW